jgi:hypothetical protein
MQWFSITKKQGGMKMTAPPVRVARRFHLAKLPIAQRHWLDQGPEVGAGCWSAMTCLNIGTRFTRELELGNANLQKSGRVT